jgi:hypothetical protein
MRVDPHLIEPVGLWKEFVKRGFIGHPKEDEDGAGDADGKSGYIDKGVKSAFQEVSEGDKEIVLEHAAEGLCLLSTCRFGKGIIDGLKNFQCKRLTLTARVASSVGFSMECVVVGDKKN